MKISRVEQETLYIEWLSNIKEPTDEECYYLRKIINEMFEDTDDK